MNRIFFNQNTNSESLPEVFINLNITGDGRIRLRSTPLRYEYLEDVTVREGLADQVIIVEGYILIKY